MRKKTNIYPRYLNAHLLSQLSLGAAARFRVLPEFLLQKLYLVLCQSWLGLRWLRKMHASLPHQSRPLVVLVVCQHLVPVHMLLLLLLLLLRGRKLLDAVRLHIHGGIRPMVWVHVFHRVEMDGSNQAQARHTLMPSDDNTRMVAERSERP